MNASPPDLRHRGVCTALVLAGQRGSTDPVAADTGISHKALVPVCGRPMLARVVWALLESRPVRSVIVSIEEPSLVMHMREMRPQLDAGVVEVVRAAESPAESVRAVLRSRSEAPHMIVTTADHALLTAAMVEHFWDAIPPGTDVAAAVADRATLQDTYPGSLRTYIRFRDTAITGANLFALTGERSQHAVAFWSKAERYRKNPLRMVSLLGASAALRFALRRMTLDEALALFSRKVGASASVVRMPFAEAGIDVDKPADLALAETILAARSASLDPGNATLG